MLHCLCMHEIQKKILKLANKKNLDGLAIRAIGRRINEEHPQNVKYHLEKLVEAGFLTADFKRKKIDRHRWPEFDTGHNNYIEP